MNRWMTIIAMAFALATTGCEMLTGPGSEEREVGILQWLPAPAALNDGPAYLMAATPSEIHVVAPETVTEGVAFGVEITTVGLNGCWQEDGADLTVSGTTATVTPYDLVVTEIDGEPAVCTAALKLLTHELQITFHEAGDGLLKVNGRIVQEGEEEEAQAIQHDVPIVILPAPQTAQ